MTPPHHTWTRLADAEPDRDPRSTLIVLVLPHWQDAQVRLRSGVDLPSPALAVTDPIGYSVAYALAVQANEQIVAQLDGEIECPAQEPVRTGDFNGDGVVDSQDYFDFLVVWGREANNGRSNR